MIADRREAEPAPARGRGYTMTPNDLLDLHMAQLSGTEFKVAMYVARRTIGFGRAVDAISLSQLVGGLRRSDGSVVDRGTGEPVASVRRAVASLVARGYLGATRRRDDAGGNLPTAYQLTVPPSDQADQRGSDQGDHTPLITVSRPFDQGDHHNRKTERKLDRQGHDDADMPARQPAPASSSTGPAVQHGLIGEPTHLIPTGRPEPKPAAEPLPPEVAAGLTALSDALGESRGSDSLTRLLVKLWRARSPGLTPALYAGAIEACRDEATAQARASYGAYFTSQLPRFVADRVTPAPKPRPRDDATSPAQRALEPHGRQWRDQTPDLLDLPQLPGPFEPPRYLEQVPVVRVAR